MSKWNIKIPPSLHHRKFALLWVGMLVSVAGSQMQLWALFWHIRTLSDQPIAVSGVGIARFVPVLLFSLVAGVVADQWDRRKILYITQSIPALVALALGLLTRSHTIQLWHIYVLTAIQATALAFDLPARQALVPNLLPRKDLANAFTLLSISSSVGSIAGPALSGLVIGYLGQEYAYFFNALSYLAIIGSLILMGPVSHEIRAAAHHSVADGIFAIKEGVQFIRKQPIILSSMILDFFATFFSSANTLLPYVAQDILHVGAIEYGWLSASQSIGSVFVGLIISQRTQIKRQGMLLLGSVFVFGVATIVFGLSRGFVLTMLALIVIGASDSVSTILRNTIRQLQTPDQLRGRMVSVNQIFFTGGPQLGEVEAGLVGQAFGIVAAIISGGIGCIAAVGLIAWRWPQLRNFTESELQPAR